MFKISTYTSNRILKVIALGLLLSIVFSFTLWTSNRDFMSFPVFEWLSFPTWIEYLLLGVLLISLLYIILGKNKERGATRIVLFILVILAFTDQMRIQPWTYFFFLLLIPFSLNLDKQVILNYFRFLFAILYLWSGYHKFNPYFEPLIFQDILIHFLGQESDSISSLSVLAIIIPILETLTGCLLLFKKTLRAGFFLAIGTHLSILYFIIFVIYGNFVILPWNLVMIFLLVILSKRLESFDDNTVRNKLLLSTLVISFLLPIGYLFDKVDQSFSFSLYDGKIREIYIVSRNPDFIDEYHEYLFADILEDGSIISISALAHNEIKVPFYPEERFLERLFNSQLMSKNNKMISTKVPFWKLSFYSESNLKAEIPLFQSDSIPNIRLKRNLMIPKWELIK